MQRTAKSQSIFKVLPTRLSNVTCSPEKFAVEKFVRTNWQNAFLDFVWFRAPPFAWRRTACLWVVVASRKHPGGRGCRVQHLHTSTDNWELSWQNPFVMKISAILPFSSFSSSHFSCSVAAVPTSYKSWWQRSQARSKSCKSTCVAIMVFQVILAVYSIVSYMHLHICVYVYIYIHMCVYAVIPFLIHVLCYIFYFCAGVVRHFGSEV